MQEHGSFEMVVEEQVIHLKIIGAWNLETALRWGAEYQANIEKIENAPWARIIDLSLWELSTPDAWACTEEFNHWANRHNQKYEVVICPYPVQKSLVDRMNEVLCNVDVTFCDNLSEAYQWLEGRGMEFTNSPLIFAPDPSLLR